MIPVSPQAEPVDFDKEVRKPGASFLKKNPTPTSKQYEKHWHKCHDQLYQAYGGICAYSGLWVPRRPSGIERSSSVDHFIPKEKRPDLAYEWTNYRLVRARLNNNKGNHMDVIDPFAIKANWFVLELPSCQIKAGPTLPPYLLSRITDTINRLELNTFVLHRERLGILQDYSDGKFDLMFLEKKYPFIAYELKRQGMETAIKVIMSKRPPKKT